MHAELKKRGLEIIAAAEFLERVEARLAKYGIGRRSSEWVLEVGYPGRQERTETVADGGNGNVSLRWGMNASPHSCVTARVELCSFSRMARLPHQELFKRREARLMYFVGDSSFYSFSVDGFDKHHDSDFPGWDPVLADFLLSRHVPLTGRPVKRPTCVDAFEIVEEMAKFYATLKRPEACVSATL